MTPRTVPQQESTRKPAKRLAAGIAAAACMVGLAVGPASASTSSTAGAQATGTFHYVGIGTPLQITNPSNGTCYQIPLSSSPVNLTNARAVVYTLPSCTGFGAPVEPGDTGDQLLFNSVRFEAVP
ncbi:hypothetical protein [Streptomyces ziwulingensis]|uniref:hypothetical protein n=1 Tax=Streptomyces ziwulingensis TaxID=1045501 RepID=UPI0031EEA8AE